jgi:predicted nucleotidyltransferase
VRAAVQNKKELIDRILASQQQIRSYGVQRLGIFGSFVRDQAKESSDVDFFIDFDIEYKTLKNFVGLAHFLQDLLGRKAEIVTPQSLNKYIGKYITQEVEQVPFAA